MKVFILLAVVAVALAREQCGENEHYTSCGTDCPLTCANYDNPPLICNLMCRIGCECDSGYVRAANGRCVRPEQCPSKAPVCGENQRFEECGSACPLTCDNYANPPLICPAMCVIGCHCEKGYVKTRDGRCVRPEECPARADQCGRNQHYTSCGTDCPLTCENYRNPPQICNLMCRIGCECDEGFVQTRDGKCIKYFQCPQNDSRQCGRNQHYTSCGTDCPLTCDNYRNPPQICNLMCRIGCECDEGFVQTRDGKCIKSFQCPQNASRPTEYTCTEKPDAGMCLAYFPSWYYDTESGTCKKFVYGGCQGNGNRYPSEEECLSHCQGVRSSPNACTLPAETGVCRGRFPRYFFDVQSGTCKEFVYGGCGGNENNFQTFEECKKLCGPQRAPQACLLEKVVGPCKANFVRWYYNKDSGKCEEFIYGGCSGNSNNFNSQDGCEAVCSN